MSFVHFFLFVAPKKKEKTLQKQRLNSIRNLTLFEGEISVAFLSCFSGKQMQKDLTRMMKLKTAPFLGCCF